jgi:hypothetical protein
LEERNDMRVGRCLDGKILLEPCVPGKRVVQFVDTLPNAVLVGYVKWGGVLGGNLLNELGVKGQGGVVHSLVAKRCI